MIRCALVQTDPKLGEKEANLNGALSALELCAKAGAQLAVFPELSLSGYCFAGRREALSIAEPVPGPSTELLAAKCRQTGVCTIVGMLELNNHRLYNSAVLIGSKGEILSIYRKTHLPYMGVDRFIDPGPGPLDAVTTPLGRIGILICYDLVIPEPARVLMLKGAEILVVLSNHETGCEVYPDFVNQTRARDNRFYVLHVNRVGVEGGMEFYGRSQACDPEGTVLAEAATGKPDVIYAGIDPRTAGNLKIVRKPGEYELDLLKDRRPELYGPITSARPESNKK